MELLGATLTNINNRLENFNFMFKLHSEYNPTGDQPQAIDYLAKGIEGGKNFKLFWELLVLVKLLQWLI